MMVSMKCRYQHRKRHKRVSLLRLKLYKTNILSKKMGSTPDFRWPNTWLTQWKCGLFFLYSDERFSDGVYAMEELVAELGSAFLCADIGISPQPRPDHAAYVDHWLKVLKADKKAIFTAASKAVDFLAALHDTTGDEDQLEVAA